MSDNLVVGCRAFNRNTGLLVKINMLGENATLECRQDICGLAAGLSQDRSGKFAREGSSRIGTTHGHLHVSPRRCRTLDQRLPSPHLAIESRQRIVRFDPVRFFRKGFAEFSLCFQLLPLPRQDSSQTVVRGKTQACVQSPGKKESPRHRGFHGRTRCSPSSNRGRRSPGSILILPQTPRWPSRGSPTPILHSPNENAPEGSAGSMASAALNCSIPRSVWFRLW